jgi:hypothetical protein
MAAEAEAAREARAKVMWCGIKILTSGQYTVWCGSDKTDRWAVYCVMWQWQDWQVDSGSCDVAVTRLTGGQCTVWCGSDKTKGFVMKTYTEVCRMCQLTIANFILLNWDSLETNLNKTGGLCIRFASLVWGCAVCAVHKDKCTAHLKVTAFWVVRPYLVNVCQCLMQTYCLSLQGCSALS